MKKAERRMLVRSLRLVEKQTNADPRMCLWALDEAQGNVGDAVSLLLRQEADALREETGADHWKCQEAAEKAHGVRKQALLHLWADESMPFTADDPTAYRSKVIQARVQLVLDGDLGLAALTTPDELHLLAYNYNWDNGIAPLYSVINQPFCDRGTALLLYWRAQSTYYYRYASRQEVSKWNREGYDFIEAVEEKYLKGFYHRQDIHFDPRDDGGSDWTQSAQETELAQPVPAEMLMPSPGKIVEWAILET